ncbi:antibiotic biosynthesis monooxygenase [Halospeciosus flavus]|uniref:Antibiotic biosynthesis monooxygenase n=1 Tax=Halospeciosus flavus TaxID=3032283 RepID=A0ABD5Z342_9EURY|nr:antibiotic biosynthesis monooxygenase [Halospeciosus flavus]
MIARIWHGWTDPSDADAYEQFVTEEVFPGVDEDVEGFAGFELLRREHADEVEFVTVARFESWDAVKAFAGEEYEEAHIPATAETLLSRYDERAEHYEVRALTAGPTDG